MKKEKEKEKEKNQLQLLLSSIASPCCFSNLRCGDSSLSSWYRDLCETKYSVYCYAFHQNVLLFSSTNVLLLINHGQNSSIKPTLFLLLVLLFSISLGYDQLTIILNFDISSNFKAYFSIVMVFKISARCFYLSASSPCYTLQISSVKRQIQHEEKL